MCTCFKFKYQLNLRILVCLSCYSYISSSIFINTCGFYEYCLAYFTSWFHKWYKFKLKWIQVMIQGSHFHVAVRGGKTKEEKINGFYTNHPVRLNITRWLKIMNDLCNANPTEIALNIHYGDVHGSSNFHMLEMKYLQL